ncbi:peroxiredoxin-like family protein [Winogradskyella sp.]|uniref:peroxiredoxin-like family protein n=1 Tax=Winogradskyella sp. TaxID=1883156 RepID=UPI002607B579|nr:peroxiredoxin-like family protein [Winogradskyella sp.]
MNTQQKITPKTQAPDLQINLLGGENWTLKDQNPENFTMLVFYRGLHCPLCEKYLKTLNGLIDDYAEKGVDIIAISMDVEARARKARMKWELSESLKIGYGLDLETANNWGLYLSKAIKDFEPEVFNEPGLFLIQPDNSIYFVTLNSTPWGRPHLASFVKVIDFINTSGYPARGELTSL